MRILVFGINYSPDLTGIGKYTGEMCSFLAAKGHQVTMVTAHPYYPHWELHSDYPKFVWKKEKIDGVKVYRCPLYIPSDPTAIKKIIHESSFIISAFPVWLSMFFKKKHDYVIGINPPFHLTVFPLVYKWVKGAKMVSHIQDLQIDVVKDLEIIRNQTLLKAMFGVESYFLKKSNSVSTISLGMQRKIASKGIESHKQWMFPNWVDVDFIKPIPKENSLREDFGLKESDKVVLYSGNMGEKQGLEAILEVAEKFKSQENLKFVIVGSGGAKSRLEEMAGEMELKNVQFFPLQPYEDLARLLAIADVHLVLQKEEASDLVMPSKLTGILSAGGVALITALPKTSLYEQVKKHEMGVLINPGSNEALYHGIKDCLESVDVEKIKFNARNYALKYLAKDSVLGKFEQDLIEGLK